MERKLYFWIMEPVRCFTIRVRPVAVARDTASPGGWLYAKTRARRHIVAQPWRIGKLPAGLQARCNRHGDVFISLENEIPLLPVLIGAVLLVC